ncbi:MAG TPA: hypothetical protein VHT30_11810 [Acidimicrobiales bacterium]|jgi:hypothetical protein|nr:hypothetical protein [Acidimicrobiales bacterium]
MATELGNHRSQVAAILEAVRGHIQQRGDAWRIHVNLGRDANGKRRSVTETIHGTRDDAEQALSRLLVQADEGRHSVAVGSVADLAARWWEATSPRWSPNTRSVQRSAP